MVMIVMTKNFISISTENLMKILLLSGLTLILISGFLSSTIMMVLFISGVTLYLGGLVLFRKIDDKPLKYFTLAVTTETVLLMFITFLSRVMSGSINLPITVPGPISHLETMIMFTVIILIFYPLLLIPVWFNVKMLDVLYNDTGIEDFKKTRSLLLLTYLTTPIVIGLVFGVIGLFYMYRGFVRMKIKPREREFNEKMFDSEFKKYSLISAGYTLLGIMFLIAFI